MYITHLQIESFRNLGKVELKADSRLNILYGANGAGKSSVLEAVYLLARGRSFRTVQPKELIQHETGAFRIFLETRDGSEVHRLGLQRNMKDWKARRDGQDIAQLSDLSRYLPVILLDPNSHSLVSGSPDGRRRYLDWGVFHVEPDFLDVWRKYARCLRQRNAALKARQKSVAISLQEMMSPLAHRLDQQRAAYFDRLTGRVVEYLQLDNSSLDQLQMQYSRGWKAESLEEALNNGLSRALEYGVTHQGPHRADIRLTLPGGAAKAFLSRGEQKIVAASLLLAQATLQAETGRKAVLLFDDLAAEFDKRHFNSVLEAAYQGAEQVWLTGVERPKVGGEASWFHVEHGRITEVV